MRRLVGGLISRILDNLMGWAVAGVAGAGFSLLVAVVAVTELHIFNLDVDDLGITQPAILFEEAKQEGTVEFRPKELQQVRVCDYSLLRGENVWEITIQYLRQYDMCFITNERGERDITVRPYLESGFMSIHNGKFYCKCSSGITAKDVERENTR